MKLLYTLTFMLFVSYLCQGQEKTLKGITIDGQGFPLPCSLAIKEIETEIIRNECGVFSGPINTTDKKFLTFVFTFRVRDSFSIYEKKIKAGNIGEAPILFQFIKLKGGNSPCEMVTNKNLKRIRIK